MKKLNLSIIVLTAALLFFYSCNTQNAKTENPAKKSTEQQAVQGSFSLNSGIKFDSSLIQEFLKSKPVFQQFRKQFDTFYRNNNYNYAWYDKNGLIESANALLSSLDNVAQEGVTADIPYRDTLEELLHLSSTSNQTEPDITTELMLTGEYFYYAKKIYAGMLNGKADSINWYLPRQKLSYASLLSENLSSGNIHDSRGVIIKLQYNGLKKALALYQKIDSNDVIIPSIKNSIKQNDSAAIVPALKKRLLQLGYISTADTNKIFDKSLAGVVSRLKEIYGLKEDSLITSSLITELNVPAKKRIEQLMVNMERLRWMPNDTTVAKEFILVNIPEYRLVYYENAEPVWRCNVVVGKPMNKTVIFSGDMKFIVFSPYWNVPTSIINKEIKPGMARNKNYLASHNMEWNNGHVRQKPGPRNSLGLVKFLFPNSNNIYLHDTPSKSLFNETNRAFSHGCIRVSQPRDLAIRVLKQDPEWTTERIDSAMHAGKETWVTLKQTIPVYIGYFTAYVGPSGNVNFRKDVYKMDDRLYNMLVQN